MNNDIVIEHHLRSLGTEAASQHIAHVYCHEGECVVCYNDRHILFSAGDCMIVINNKLLDGIKPSADFKCTAIYIRTSFLKVCSPDNNYFVRGIMTLFTNPVMKLLPDEQEICQADFLNVEHRLHRTSHRFYQNALAVALQGLFLDFHDFHARIHGFADVPVQAASLLARFFSMLESGACRTHREVAYFASELCVVPKHLSDTCYKLSGFSALYWIKRFALQEIKHLLRDKSLTIIQIADIMDFSSAAYFNRYVRQNLGITPTEYRK